jgi:hypothetical protein
MPQSAQVGDILEDYARRGVFQGFSRQYSGKQRSEYRLVWHRNQHFQLTYDASRQALRISCVLPEVPAASSMYRDFKAWLRARQDPALPDHRRCDRQRLSLKTYNRDGAVALTLKMLDDDVDYGVRKLLSLVNEIYLDFLSSGLYFDWLVQTFDLDPDHPY